MTAVLVLIPLTRWIRLALWPITVVLALHATSSTDFALNDPRQAFWNIDLVVSDTYNSRCKCGIENEGAKVCFDSAVGQMAPGVVFVRKGAIEIIARRRRKLVVAIAICIQLPTMIYWMRMATILHAEKSCDR
ncbi:hypothetical protein BJ138DRAFT_1144655 [Hygrophoropsis aurantiaca]|uniref:Uncharacterized protein n=1 Tax=Hygrophoropsis aurantiaca TaxID=72124 RepID=A0ACB8AKL2_9AGAM|nr:hypothetical protein BJ138DRAFT_1144655 [Hygrophoropsis aurantiaca]